jgi:SAM-dependent methyltransferase
MVSLNRVVMNKSSAAWLRALPLHEMELAEISGKWGQRLEAKSYERFKYPEHDICLGPYLDKAGRARQFDLILANQVWEHLDRPFAALCHVHDMLRAGGYFWIAVPFFLPFHAAPNDCSRWSARGLKNLLIEAGFPEAHIRAQEWGNRAAAARNLEPHWPPKYDPETDDLTNDPAFPICAWALAQKRA